MNAGGKKVEKEDLILEEDSLAKWFIRLVKGIAVGIGAILPGLSGGVLAVIFNIYDPLLKFLANIRKNFMANMRYFIPIGIGGVIGVVVFSIFVEQAFGQYAAQFTCLFIGFVAGTFPSLYKTAGAKGRNKTDGMILAAAAIAIFFVMILGSGSLTEVTPSFFAWVFSGALIGLGVIIPGMSPSNFLIYFGLYDKMATGISSFNLGVVIPLAIGLVICVLLFAKAANWLFQRYYSKMYHFILGLVVGSSLAIFPTTVFPSLTAEGLSESGLTFMTAIIFSIIMFVVGALFSYWFSQIEKRYSTD